MSCERFSPPRVAFLAAVTAGYEPETYADAIQLEVWRDAMTHEIVALEDQHTWDITDLPPGKVAIGCRWVYKLKFNSNGRIERHKSRLLALGNRQKEGQDYK